MANSSEIADIEGLRKVFVSLNSELDKSSTLWLKMGGNIEATMNTARSSAKSYDDLTRAKKATIETNKQMDALDRQMATNAQKLKDLENGRIEQLLRSQKAVNDATQALRNKIKAEDAEEGSLVRMRQRLSELTAAHDRLKKPTEESIREINALSREIGKAEEATNRGQRSVGQYGKMWEGLKGLLPVFSIAAMGAAVVGVFNSIKNSTGETADKFEFAMKGMKTGLDFFWKTLATGDWSNFFTNLKNATTGGYQYAKMLDEVADNKRALGIIESNARGEELRLEEMLRNSELTPEERAKAGADRIKLEEKLAVDRQRISDKNFQAELNETMRQTKLSKEKLMIIAKDIDSEKKLRADEYNEAVEFQNSRRTNKTSEEYAKYLPIIKNATQDTKEYAAVLKGFEIATDEQRDKFASAWIQNNEAINSAAENTKRVRTQVHSQLNTITTAEKKNNDDSVVNAKKAAEDKIVAEQKAVDAFVKGMYEKMDDEAKFLANQDKNRAEQKKE
ncbi:MAG: hypothetical protein JZU49_04815, partial [Sulfuricurvum sp.]|nr:hypothetical protein [Sulfuricurvum sp.]